MKVVINTCYGGFGLSEKAYDFLNTWHDKKGDHYEYILERHDPSLVQCVEILKKEAWGECSELEVVEIPDGIEYEIVEYDGYEYIAEKHRKWYGKEESE